MKVLDIYICDGCGRKCGQRGADEETAVAEMKRLWGDIPPAERGVLCDDCFEDFMKWQAKNVR